MSTPTRVLLVVGLFGLMAAFGLSAVFAAPDGGRGIGIWPVAMATALLMVTRRPPTWVWVGLVGLVGAATISTQRPPEVALGLGAGLAAQVWVAWRVVCRGRRERAPLLTIADLSRFLVAITAGALTMAAVSAVTSLAADWGDPALLALTTGTSGLAAQITLLPFFCRFRHHPAVGSRVERLAQWTLLLAIAVAVLLPTQFPSFPFLVLPVLAWGALRNGSYEAVAQMLVAVGLAMLLTTTGRGPFARPDLRFDVPVDLQGIFLGTFAIVCALVVLALRLTVGEQLEYARQVGVERDRLRNVVDGITTTAIIGSDPSGTCTLFNPGAERLLGYDAEEFVGRSTRLLHTPAQVAAKAAEVGVPDDFGTVARALMGTGPTSMGFVRKDGEERQHLMSLNRVHDDRGEVIGYVSTSEDVTEWLHAEARLVESLETERQAVEQLREVDRVKDAFVSSVSHELRTPITSILGYTELLQEGSLGDLAGPQADAVERISKNSSRLLTLISELLTLSRVHADGELERAENVDLAEAVRAGLAVLAPIVQRRELEMLVDLPSCPLQVTGDRELLERVVVNLAENAVKFTPDGGRVSLTLTGTAEHAVLEVADTGIGVPAHEQQRLFDRFFRSSLALQHAIPGSGLGLSIARRIVEQHGGSLEVRSEAGRGSTFRVCLPAP